MSADDPRLAATLMMAEVADWRQFFTACDGRTPLKGDGFGHGCRDATADPDELRRRWALCGGAANIALATGAGLLAIDIDRKNGVDGFTTRDLLCETLGIIWPLAPCSRTPSSGAHYLMSYEGPSPKNRAPIRDWHEGAWRIWPGIDVRADGGSIALPPSRRADGEYTWLRSPLAYDIPAVPPALMKLLRSEEPPPPPREPISVRNLDRTARYVAAALDKECTDLAKIGSGSRNASLFQAAASLGELVGAGLLPEQTAAADLEAAAQANGLWRDDGAYAVRATIRSGLRAGMSQPREIVG